MNLFDVYPLFDIEIDRGNGCHVYDNHGTEYLDLYGGHAVISVGHCHPKIVKAINEQASKLMFYSNSVINPLQQKLAEKLGKVSGYDDYQLFLVNSGAEANENALKLASFHTGKSRVIAYGKAFHGRTSAAVEVTDNPKIVSPINDNGHVTFLPLNDIDATINELKKGDVCAVIIEGIQGVGGIRIPSDDFLRVLRQECDQYGAVLILDEIQSGYGRTGNFFAHQHAGVRPDIVTCAKGIANGFPMGAVLIAPSIEASKGMLGTTFGGNHLACAAAIAVLDVMQEEHLVENAAEIGQYLISKLQEMASHNEEIVEVRGRGLMIGIEIKGSASALRKQLLFEGKIFTGGAGEHTVRLLPALGITREQADTFLTTFEKFLK